VSFRDQMRLDRLEQDEAFPVAAAERVRALEAAPRPIVRLPKSDPEEVSQASAGAASSIAELDPRRTSAGG
jgi:hypothetical protein